MVKAKAAKTLQKRRLLKLDALLQADAKNKKGIRFDINSPGYKVNGKAFNPKEVVPLDCGTSACAMGLASISGAFKKQGLGYKVDGDHIWSTFNSKLIDYDLAAMKLFGITKEQAHYLFAPWTYPFEKQKGAAAEREVVRRIKRVVEGKPIKKESPLGSGLYL
jgi:hypothetical protein